MRQDSIPRTELRVPKEVYLSVKYTILDHGRMVKERNSILLFSPAPGGIPKSSGSRNPMAENAEKLAALDERVVAINTAVRLVAKTYGKKIKRDDVSAFDWLDAFKDYGSFCYQLYDPEKEAEPSRRTWYRYKNAIIFEVAKEMRII